MTESRRPEARADKKRPEKRRPERMTLMPIDDDTITLEAWHRREDS